VPDVAKGKLSITQRLERCWKPRKHCEEKTCSEFTMLKIRGKRLKSFSIVTGTIAIPCDSTFTAVKRC
jgi:hypothetical protein